MYPMQRRFILIYADIIPPLSTNERSLLSPPARNKIPSFQAFLPPLLAYNQSLCTDTFDLHLNSSLLLWTPMRLQKRQLQQTYPAKGLSAEERRTHKCGKCVFIYVFIS